MPRKKSARVKLFNQAKNWGVTLVFFESPYRLVKSLGDIADIFAERRVALVREMTKKFEEVIEDNAGLLPGYFNKRLPKGEYVIIIEKCGKNCV